MTTFTDPYSSSRETTEGTVFSVTGGDWNELVTEIGATKEEHIVVNMGPQHPSTHGVLRLVLELEGETVTEVRCGIGYLHTGIEKNIEYRSWTQGVTFVTRMDYLSPLFNETAYCLATEKLLGITNDVPERASAIRVLMMELNRISSHMVALGTGALELGAITPMFFAFRERERVLDIFEMISGLRMNMAYIRPGGVQQDLPAGATQKIRETVKEMRKAFKDNATLLIGNSIWMKRTVGIGYLDLAGCTTLGITGPVLRSTGLPWDLRKTQPYCGYENYDFDVVTTDTCDVYGRFLIRMNELEQSLRIIEQACDKIDKLAGAPVMVADKKIAWPAQLAMGGDGLGNSLDHIREIMGTSMESLIHHFKLVTEGFRVPAGQVYAAVESPRGELGAHIVSDGGTRPYRMHFREPSFNNLQSTSAMCEGSMVADIIGAVASIDPVMGGVDR
ncbi:NADH-quinone oxidoreductase subunit D [Candidatus Planktophila limnetica]|jgi:NADH-quinone oxidoreductase subunit D|uniref:NADH-quinone oxidoreductase subunit D n=1 Tax=Candidatus Planktophila limnetica TaxID=573600 RepID=A0A249LH24_9ACTN|nr:NADH-quinone oxidoreductase subunit D [Candidatus Planktophila limnetica]ASY28216.1 NADH-quinone oxidoreductase subunit D [Candidatus Planktophila limnetica]